jgi:hypothetical protein
MRYVAAEVWPEATPEQHVKFEELIERYGLGRYSSGAPIPNACIDGDGVTAPASIAKIFVSDDRMTVLDPIGGKYGVFLGRHAKVKYGLTYTPILTFSENA